MALACASNRALSSAIMRSPGSRSERAVKPRRSEDHSTALISSPVPLQAAWKASSPLFTPR
jgi:hypothetical protein